MIWVWLLRNPLQTALGAAALAFFIAAGYHSIRADRAETAKAEIQAAWDADKLQAEQVTRAGEARDRQREQDNAKRTEDAEAKHAQEIAIRDARIAALLADRNRLRNEIAAYASGPADPAADTLAAARERAEALGVLLGQADERAERDARELETLNAEKRLLLEAWPK